MAKHFIKIISLNAQGLCEALKFHKIKQHFLYREEERPDVFTFQETKWSEKYAKLYAQSFPEKVVFAHAKDHSGGIVLGVSNTSGLQISKHVTDAEGRYIVAECGKSTEKFTIASVYLKPNLTISELTDCLGEISREVISMGNPQTVWLGDFNIIIDPSMDTSSKNKISNTKFVEGLHPLMDHHDLSDTWRVLHPFKSRYTCFTKTSQGITMSRLDLALASPAFMTGIIDVTIGTAFHSDHAPIYVEFQLESEPQGKGYWKFPNHLLTNEAYVQLLKTQIPEFIAQTAQCTPGLQWDTVKMLIRWHAIDYSSLKCKKSKKFLSPLKEKIALLSQGRDEAAYQKRHALAWEYTPKIAQKQEELYLLQSELQQDRDAFYNAQKYYELDRCTKFNFKKWQHGQDAIKLVYDTEGHLQSNPRAILNTCTQYYSTLYTQSPTHIPPDIKENLMKHIPHDRLSTQDKMFLGANITLDEIHQSLKKMKTDSTPGMDGLNAQFYNIFWQEIKDLLFKTYLFAFETGSLSLSQRQGIIRLIPKKNKNPWFVSSWRPITLLNVDYKILTKLFAERLLYSYRI